MIAAAVALLLSAADAPAANPPDWAPIPESERNAPAAEAPPAPAAPAPSPAAAAPRADSCEHEKDCDDTCERDEDHHRWGKDLRKRPWRFALEAGPVFNRGMGLQLSVRPRPRSGFALGVGAMFGRPLDDDRWGWRGHWHGDDDGFRSAIRQGYYVSVSRYAATRRGGFFASLQLGMAQALARNDAGEEARFWTLGATPVIGAQWFPFRGRFFLKPQLGVTVTAARWGNAPLFDQRLQPPYLSPMGALQLGLAI